jgi:hypothetical protein
MVRLAPQPMPGGGFGFWLEADAVAVDVPRSEMAGFLRQAAPVAAEVWRAYRARGLDVNGFPMKPIHSLTRKARRDNINPVSGRKPYSPMGTADEAAAPLQATRGASRLQSLLRWKVQAPRGIWFYWATDRHTGKPWGEILDAHRKGFARFFVYPQRSWGFVPSRNVFGFSPEELTEIRDKTHGFNVPKVPTPLTTAEVIRRVRAGDLQPKKPVRYVRISERDIVAPGTTRAQLDADRTMGPTIRLSTDGGPELPIKPIPAPAPIRERRAYATAYARIAPGFRRMIGDEPTAGRLAGLILKVGWAWLLRLGLLALLIEWIRGAAWDDVVMLFGLLGMSSPADKDEAEKIVNAIAENRAA